MEESSNLREGLEKGNATEMVGLVRPKLKWYHEDYGSILPFFSFIVLFF